MTDAHQTYISEKITAQEIAVEAVGRAFGAEVRVVEPNRTGRKVIQWVILPLAVIPVASVIGALAWTYGTNYSLYCGQATEILGYQMCDNSADGWTHDPTPTEWSKIDPVLRSEHLAGTVWVFLGIGLFGYAVFLAGVALRRRGRSLWWLAIIVLGPLAIIVGIVLLFALARLAEGSNHKGPWGQPKQVFKPDGLTTSKQQAEWQARFGRGTPQNLWGIYKAGGQLRIDQGKDVYYLGDDEQWHLLGPGRPPHEAWRQGAIS
jgi:hypothetical protein